MTGLRLLAPLIALPALLGGDLVRAADPAAAERLPPPRKIHGLCFGPYLDGQDPTKGAVVTEEQINARLALLKGDTRWIRTYGSAGGLEKVPKLAKAMGFQVAAGAWLDRHQSPAARERELAALEANIRGGWVDIAIVGNEVLVRNEMPVKDLIDVVNAFRKRVNGAVPVAPAETYWNLIAHPEVMAASDVVLAHFYGFWQDSPIEDAVAILHRQHHELTRLSGKEVIVAETGWPSGGGAKGRSVPSPENEARYFREVLDWADAGKAKVFFMAAFDERWKSEGGVGAHWGIRDAKGDLKPGIAAALAGPPGADVWTRKQPGEPGVVITDAGKIGDKRAAVRGKVTGVSHATAHVQVFIRVDGTWWPKFAGKRLLTGINPDGTFWLPIVTGGRDDRADAVRVYLVSEDHVAGKEPPAEPLPPTVLAKAEAERK